MPQDEIENKKEPIPFTRKLILFTSAAGMDIVGWMVGYDGHTMQVECPIIIIDVGHGDVGKSFSSFGNFSRVFNFNVSQITSVVDADEALTDKYETLRRNIENKSNLFIPVKNSSSRH